MNSDSFPVWILERRRRKLNAGVSHFCPCGFLTEEIILRILIFFRNLTVCHFFLEVMSLGILTFCLKILTFSNLFLGILTSVLEFCLFLGILAVFDSDFVSLGILSSVLEFGFFLRIFFS